MSRDIRVIECDDMFIPQVKGLLWGWNDIKNVQWIDGTGLIKTNVEFMTKESAIMFAQMKYPENNGCDTVWRRYDVKNV